MWNSSAGVEHHTGGNPFVVKVPAVVQYHKMDSGEESEGDKSANSASALPGFGKGDRRNIAMLTLNKRPTGGDSGPPSPVTERRGSLTTSSLKVALKSVCKLTFV